jgi:hypothetical protein
MPCVLTDGYTLDCRSIAGVQAVYIGTWNGPTLTYTQSTATGSVGLITSFNSGTSSFYKFEQPIETGSLTETGNFNVQNGTAYYDQVVEITTHNTDQNLINKVNALGRGKWRIIVLDVNGNYFLVGKQNPVYVTGVAGGAGKAYGDLNGFTITFTGKEFDVLTQVSASAALQVITPP